MSKLIVSTSLGRILLQLCPDAAPVTTAHITKLSAEGLYDGTSFYRSDFVIQAGLHGSSKKNLHPNLSVNESRHGAGGKALSNLKGACAVAHWDTPDCGNSEWFISLKDNPHLDSAYGGYAVFGRVEETDAASWATIDAIAKAIASKSVAAVKIEKIEVA